MSAEERHQLLTLLVTFKCYKQIGPSLEGAVQHVIDILLCNDIESTRTVKEHKANVVEDKFGRVLGFFYPLNFNDGVKFRVFDRKTGATELVENKKEALEWFSHIS